MLRIGHRGAAGSRPEHTRPSFERAMQLGVDMIELDVQLTRDGRLVVLHDRELGRTLRGSGPVRSYRLDELQAMDAGGWFDSRYEGERVLSLEQVLDLTKGRVNLNVEIKSPEPDWEKTAALLVDILHRHERSGTTLVSCFETGALECVRAADRRVRLGVLWEAPDLEPMWRAARELEAVSVHPNWAFVCVDLVAAAHTRGFDLVTWTVNEASAMRELSRSGVDGIISDFPERFPRD